MPTKLARMKALQEQIAQMEKTAEQLQNDPEVQRQKECLSMVNELLKEYSVTIDEIVAMVRPGCVITKAGQEQTPVTGRSTRAPRRTKRYKNPHTGAVVLTRGANHLTLREWREQWGAEAVDSWWSYEE